MRKILIMYAITCLIYVSRVIIYEAARIVYKPDTYNI